jgi:hypothetical protein
MVTNVLSFAIDLPTLNGRKGHKMLTYVVMPVGGCDCEQFILLTAQIFGLWNTGHLQGILLE